MTSFLKNNMRCNTIAAAFALIASTTFATNAFAGEASTSATAGFFGRGPGTATATAGYTGNGQGIARTNTHSGNQLAVGRGLSFGIDEDGVSLSASNAIATRNGQAVATNFNLSIGFDGSVSQSRGVSVAEGGSGRSASAGGSAGIIRGTPVATSFAGGQTRHGGRVQATTETNTNGPRRVWRIRR